MQYKVDFNSLDWQFPFEGIRHKVLDQGGFRLRLVEYHKDMPPHWCEKAHYGLVLEGIFEIEFPDQRVTYHKGDGLFLPPGSKHRHRGISITERTLIFFLETLS